MASPSAALRPAEATSLLLHSVNVVRTIKPSSHGVVADALHHSLHFALDGLPQDWQFDPTEVEIDAAEADTANASSGCGPSTSSSSAEACTPTTLANGQRVLVKPGFLPNPNPSSGDAADRLFISYRYNDAERRLSIPHPLTTPDPLQSDPCGPENREAHDVSAKFFFLDAEEGGAGSVDGADTSSSSSQEEEEDVDMALSALRKNTGLVTVDTLVFAFEDVSRRWEGHAKLKEEGVSGLTEAERRRFDADVARISRVWRVSQMSHS